MSHLPRVILASPLRGPVNGLSAVTRMTLTAMQGRWDIRHVETATAATNAAMGTFTSDAALRMVDATYRLWVALRTHRPDLTIIQCAKNRTGFLKYALLATVARACHVPIVARFGGDGFGGFYAGLLPPWRRVVERVLGWGHVLVEAECLQRQFSGIVPAHRVHWCYLGVEPRSPRTSTPPHRLIYVGHLTRAKGVHLLVAAAQQVRKEFPDVQVSLLGEHFPQEGLSPLPAYVYAPGPVTEGKFAYLEASDIFVFPSYSEGMPMAVLEAMSVGLPIVCTRVGALPEILEQDLHCRFIEVGSVKAIGDAVRDLYRYPGCMRLMELANRKAIQERFTLAQYAERLDKVCNQRNA